MYSETAEVNQVQIKTNQRIQSGRRNVWLDNPSEDRRNKTPNKITGKWSDSNLPKEMKKQGITENLCHVTKNRRQWCSVPTKTTDRSTIITIPTEGCLHFCVWNVSKKSKIGGTLDKLDSQEHNKSIWEDRDRLNLQILIYKMDIVNERKKGASFLETQTNLFR